MKRLPKTVMTGFALLLTSAAQAQFDLSWNTIDGGGPGAPGFSTGGTFSLGGTIGQPDAGAVMTGGTFTLTGGFWAGAGSQPCTLVGDFNHNGAVSLSDLTILLAHFGVASGASPDDGDITGDGAISLADLTQFLSHFGSVCP